MAKKNIILTDLAKEIEQFSRDVARELAIDTREQLVKEASLAINKFYSHYTPEHYHRHLPIGKNIKKSFRKYYANAHNYVYSGGIEISSDWMNDIYRADKDYVFNLIYAGYHGNVAMFPFQVNLVPPIMSPSPLDIILDKRDELIKGVQNNANKIASQINKSGYKFIK